MGALITRQDKLRPFRLLGKALYAVCITLACLSVSVSGLRPAVLVNTASLLMLRKANETSRAKIVALEGRLRAVASARSGAAVYRKLGQVLLLQDKRQQAVDVLTEGITHYPDDYVLALQLGDVLMSLGERQRAVEQWQRAGVTPSYFWKSGLTYHPPGRQIDPTSRRAMILELWPDSSSAWYVMGQIFWDEGALEDAIGAYAKAVALDRDWEPNQRTYAHDYLRYLLVRVGGGLQQERRSQEAIAYLSQAVALYPDDAHIYYLLSLAERDEKQYEQAIKHIRIAISKVSDVAAHYQHLAELYVAVGNKPGAINALKRASMLSPGDAGIQKMLSDLQAR